MTEHTPNETDAQHANEMRGCRVGDCSKKILRALEKVFAAEIDNRLPFQSKAKIYRDLLSVGLLRWMERKIGTDRSGMTVSGYELSHAGRILYCTSCDDEPPNA